MHTASPFPMVQPKDEQELIKPAVDGTLAAMRAAQQHKVKRVVVTSSMAAKMNKVDRNHVHITADDWSELEACGSAYEKSKTMAERAAWDFVAALPENEKFELSVVTHLPPTLIFNPPV